MPDADLRFEKASTVVESYKVKLSAQDNNAVSFIAESMIGKAWLLTYGKLLKSRKCRF
jgi:hypothetical protein